MSFALVLNSSNLVGSNNSNFQYNFVNGGFVAKDAEIALIATTYPYSWYNITPAYNNQSFTINFPTGASGMTPLNITLPAGYYSATDIQTYIEQQCIANNYYLKDSGGNYVYYFYMTYNLNYYKIQILFTAVPTSKPSGWSLPTAGTGGWAAGLPTSGFTPQLVLPSTGSISTIIGFVAGASYPSATTTTSTSILSTLTPNATNVNALIVRCSIVKNNIGSPTDILDQINITTTYGSAITYAPSFERWVKVSDGTYSNFQLTFQDQNFNTLYALDPNVSITLLIKNRVK